MGTKIRASGADVSFIAAFESTYGTAPTAGSGIYYRLPFLPPYGVGGEKPLGSDQLLGQGRDAQDPFYESISVSGPMNVPVDLRAIGFILKGLLGAPTTTGTGPYTHVYKSGLALPSLTLELGHPQLTTAEYLQHTGAKLGDCQIDFSRSGAAKASLNVIAQGETKAGASLDATPDSYDLTRFMQANGSIKVGGSQLGSVQSGSLKFSNNLDPVETIRADGKIDGIDEADFTADLTVTVRKSTDTTLSSPIDAETPVAFTLGFVIPSTSYKLEFALPRVFLPKKKGEVSGPKGIDVTYEGKAALDSTAGYLLQATLINDIASY